MVPLIYIQNAFLMVTIEILQFTYIEIEDQQRFKSSKYIFIILIYINVMLIQMGLEMYICISCYETLA